MTSINEHRLKREPLERRFLEVWDKKKKQQKILSYILDRDHTNRGDYLPTEEEVEIADTLIQWLGTPVGQGFLGEVMDEYNSTGRD